MAKRLYVAYGSNLNLDQMKYRCPTAKLYGTGVLEGYELQFKGSPYGAFATIAPKEGASVPVALWEIKPRDEQYLDRYEGYPSHYFKQDVDVQLGDRTAKAMVYVMNLKMDFGMPSPQYYQTVRQGYKDCGLDIGVLENAIKDSTQKFYNSHSGHARQQSLFDYEALDDHNEYEDYDYDPFADEEQEPDESDPFYVSDGMSFGGR